MSKRRRFSDEFKHEAVALTRQPGSTITQVARDIGVTAGLLGRWRRELISNTSKALAGSGVPRDQEMLVLKRELARVNKERVGSTGQRNASLSLSAGVMKPNVFLGR